MMVLSPIESNTIRENLHFDEQFSADTLPEKAAQMEMLFNGTLSDHQLYHTICVPDRAPSVYHRLVSQAAVNASMVLVFRLLYCGLVMGFRQVSGNHCVSVFSDEQCFLSVCGELPIYREHDSGGGLSPMGDVPVRAGPAGFVRLVSGAGLCLPGGYLRSRVHESMAPSVLHKA